MMIFMVLDFVDLFPEEDMLHVDQAAVSFFCDEWRERGRGDVMTVQSRVPGKVRFMIREPSTKIISNFYVFDAFPCSDLRPQRG